MTNMFRLLTAQEIAQLEAQGCKATNWKEIEVADAFEGLEGEIAPDIRPNVSKGVRTYLEGMTNLGIHTCRLSKTVQKDGKEKTLVKYACHLGANEYYWTKVQTKKGIEIPNIIVNPSYDKLMTILNGGN